MEQLAGYRAHLISRLRGLVAELGLTQETILLCQVWATAQNGQDADQPLLRVEAQSPLTGRNESIATYASLSMVYGIRKEAMELIGDCHFKGATRIIEDLEHADCTQHPRNLLPGHDIPACSALFIPIFDPADPFAQNHALGMPMPTCVLEILVCETAKSHHNNSDLIHEACHVLDQYQFGISKDTTAFREWSKFLSPRNSNRSSGFVSPSKASPMAGLSRTCSRQFLLSSDDSDDSMVGVEANAFGRNSFTARRQRHSPQNTMGSLPESGVLAG